jgi:hypothetical protein
VDDFPEPGAAQGEDDPPDARPEDRARAHRTELGARVQDAGGKLIGVEVGDGSANEVQLGVRGTVGPVTTVFSASSTTFASPSTRSEPNGCCRARGRRPPTRSPASDDVAAHLSSPGYLRSSSDTPLFTLGPLGMCAGRKAVAHPGRRWRGGHHGLVMWWRLTHMWAICERFYDASRMASSVFSRCAVNIRLPASRTMGKKT